MKFYSGFSLKNEEYLFEDYISDSEYTVSGFSYGAIKAFEKTLKLIKNANRVDTLQLFSPAFFQTKEDKFKKLQLLGYRKNRDKYLSDFMELCFSPHYMKITEHYETEVDELEELLNYKWDINNLKLLSSSGVKIEVYLGSEDKIIDVESARSFFLHVSTVTYIKNVNHFLQTN
jgi:esterase/lipase